MSLFTQSDLQELLRHQASPCVSIYLPTHRAGREIQQDPTRLKNLLKEAETLLGSRLQLKPVDAEALLAPAADLLIDTSFWRHQQDGLALFLAPDFFRFYQAPLVFEERVTLGSKFQVKQILPLLTHDGAFFVLAISQNEVRLLQGSRDTVSEIPLHDIPTSLDDVLREDATERHLQFHTKTPSGSGGRFAVFHGHGGGHEVHKERLLPFFRQIDKGIRELIRDQRAPLVLAGVEYLFSFYREINRYPHLMNDGVRGNPEGLSAKELHAAAWRLVEPWFEAKQTLALSAFHEHRNHNGKSVDDLAEILGAVHQGRVETLFVPRGQQCWGEFDAANGTIREVDQPANGEDDLLNTAAVQALLHHGEVFALAPDQMPGSSRLAALLRY